MMIAVLLGFTSLADLTGGTTTQAGAMSAFERLAAGVSLFDEPLVHDREGAPALLTGRRVPPGQAALRELVIVQTLH